MAQEPIHPGKILADELTELGISAVELARQIKVPANRISKILSGKKIHYRRYGLAAWSLVWNGA